jgi:ABC-2 type transport system permease protein
MVDSGRRQGARKSRTLSMKDFARGVIDSRPVVFYVSFTIFFLFLTLKVVESRRWK